MSTKKICTQCGTEFGSEQKFCPNDGSPLRVESTDDRLIGQVIADRYHITALIGEGGMGRVYLAEHVRMGRKSALKVMSPALATTADAITRFNREASNASRINHPNVAAIYDFGETPDGLLYLAMEYVEGETLHALINRGGPLPAARAAAITKGAADALHAAHHLGIIHRDLKPDNIMLSRQLDGSDWVKVVDFGIAKSMGSQGPSGGQTVTTAGVSLGTPEYMSPEQLAGERLDHRTDIYSLGLVLFNMLTGALPYPRLTSKETLVRRLTSRPAGLAEVRPDIDWPAPLQAVLDRALAPEPEHRYASVADLGREVIDAAASAPAIDPDRTLRVSAPSRPALAATAVNRPKSAAGPGRTRPLPPPAKPKRGARTWAAAGALLLVAVAAFALVHRNPRPAAASSVPVDRDSTRDTTAAAPDTTAAASAPVARDTTAPSPAPVPLRAATHKDAAPPSQPPAAPALTDTAAAPTAAAAPVTVRTRHPWLRANGDSVATPDSSGRQGVNAAVNEIRGHFERAGRFVAANKPGQAGNEMRDAQGEIKMLRDLMPGANMPPAVGQELRMAASRAVSACFSAAGTQAGALQRCANLEQRFARGGRGGRGGRKTPPGGG